MAERKNRPQPLLWFRKMLKKEKRVYIAQKDGLQVYLGLALTTFKMAYRLNGTSVGQHLRCWEISKILSVVRRIKRGRPGTPGLSRQRVLDL